ncbi:MAG: DUF4982 domain-containing protein [Lachnospiraceae bacterium]|nr:DUF4982 domain-containing protein [Lachnospiraceae bacterium]
MLQIDLDEKWTFRRGFLDSAAQLEEDPGEEVNLPHDGMIGTPVTADAPARSDSGYYHGNLTNYTKNVLIPDEWKNECVGLLFDGVMMNATVEINGSLICRHHYGYTPFYVDLTPWVTFGEENRITVNTNTSMQPNSRWYTGSGLYRSVRLCHGQKLHIRPDGIYAFTKEVADGIAFLEAQVELDNASQENCLAEVTVIIQKENGEEAVAQSRVTVHVNAMGTQTARLTLQVKDPMCWSAEEPNLYQIRALVKNLGEYRTHYEKAAHISSDEDSSLFGIRTVTADSVRGLQINGTQVKLKGGCLHHDNGLIGAVSLYEMEARKVKKLKEAGFNAIRTAHNPPSKALIEACDRLGMYIFDEAFDAWGMAKRGGDFSQFFAADWEKELTAFVKRDRTHPSVILWSTGNEIPERGGLGNGYELAGKLACAIRRLDGTRPVSNGICSMWSGLDDKLAAGMRKEQNAGESTDSFLWEEVTEPFAAGLDVVGYNYMEELYERDHERYPERVILGSENFPKEIGYRWPFVEAHPYVIGDFTWTAWDYLGEAGIGKAAYVDPDDPLVEKGPWALMPQYASPFPWRTANCGDFDITGAIRPQGAYRSIVWGSGRTCLYSMHPKDYGKTEIVSMWGFPAVAPLWDYAGFEGRPVEVIVFSGAEEVELVLNGSPLGRKRVSTEKPMPCTVRFETGYRPGKLEAISFCGGKEVSRDVLLTPGEPSQIALLPEKKEMCADGHDLICVGIEIRDSEGNPVRDASVALRAEAEGSAKLTAFGSGNPVTAEDYTDPHTITCRGCALAVLRAGYESGPMRLTVTAEGFPPAVFTGEVFQR